MYSLTFTCRSRYKISGIDWKIHVGFELANRRIALRAAPYQWRSPRDCLGRNCGIGATAMIRRVIAVARNSASCIQIMLGTPIPDAVPASPSNSRLSRMSSTGIIADPCRVAAEAASKVRAALIVNVSVTKRFDTVQFLF